MPSKRPRPKVTPCEVCSALVEVKPTGPIPRWCPNHDPHRNGSKRTTIVPGGPSAPGLPPVQSPAEVDPEAFQRDYKAASTGDRKALGRILELGILRASMAFLGGDLKAAQSIKSAAEALEKLVGTSSKVFGHIELTVQPPSYPDKND